MNDNYHKYRIEHNFFLFIDLRIERLAFHFIKNCISLSFSLSVFRWKLPLEPDISGISMQPIQRILRLRVVYLTIPRITYINQQKELLNCKKFFVFYFNFSKQFVLNRFHLKSLFPPNCLQSTRTRFDISILFFLFFFLLLNLYQWKLFFFFTLHCKRIQSM